MGDPFNKNIIPDVYDIAPEVCRCGRNKVPLHCPECGSVSTFAYAAANYLDTNGLIIAYGVRCRRCGQTYNKFTPCCAPLSIQAKKRMEVRMFAQAKQFERQREMETAQAREAEEERLRAELAEKLKNPESRKAVLDGLFGKTKPPME